MGKTNPLPISEEELFHLYINEAFSLCQIVKLLGMPTNSFRGIKQALTNMGVKRRSRAEAVRLSYKSYGMHWKPEQYSSRIHLEGEYKKRIYDGKTMISGYIALKCPDHPRAGKNGYIFEHQLVWEQTHQRLLPKGWVVHHLNGIKTDNRPENLVAVPSLKHQHILAAKAKRIQELEAKLNETTAKSKL